jgi:hypothetical protein
MNLLIACVWSRICSEFPAIVGGPCTFLGRLIAPDFDSFYLTGILLSKLARRHAELFAITIHCLLPTQRLKFAISDFVGIQFAATTSLAVAGSIRLRPLGNLHTLVNSRTGHTMQHHAYSSSAFSRALLFFSPFQIRSFSSSIVP